MLKQTEMASENGMYLPHQNVKTAYDTLAFKTCSLCGEMKGTIPFKNQYVCETCIEYLKTHT